jgi:hypothetical protein
MDFADVVGTIGRHAAYIRLNPLSRSALLSRHGAPGCNVQAIAQPSFQS